VTHSRQPAEGRDALKFWETGPCNRLHPEAIPPAQNSAESI